MRIRVGRYAGDAGSLDITSDDVKLVADDRSGKAVARNAHTRKALVPRIRSRIVSLRFRA